MKRKDSSSRRFGKSSFLPDVKEKGSIYYLK